MTSGYGSPRTKHSRPSERDNLSTSRQHFAAESLKEGGVRNVSNAPVRYGFPNAELEANPAQSAYFGSDTLRCFSTLSTTSSIRSNIGENEQYSPKSIAHASIGKIQIPGNSSTRNVPCKERPMLRLRSSKPQGPDSVSTLA